MPVAIQLRRGTAAAWTAANPVLAIGEPGIETDTRRWKVGDGATAWNTLAYMNRPRIGPVNAVGAINGSNATFTTPSNYVPLTLQVYVNGTAMAIPGDYSESPPNGFTLTFSPAVGETVTVVYEGA